MPKVIQDYKFIYPKHDDEAEGHIGYPNIGVTYCGMDINEIGRIGTHGSGEKVYPETRQLMRFINGRKLCEKCTNAQKVRLAESSKMLQDWREPRW